MDMRYAKPKNFNKSWTDWDRERYAALCWCADKQMKFARDVSQNLIFWVTSIRHEGDGLPLSPIFYLVCDDFFYGKQRLLRWEYLSYSYLIYRIELKRRRNIVCLSKYVWTVPRWSLFIQDSGGKKKEWSLYIKERNGSWVCGNFVNCFSSS